MRVQVETDYPRPRREAAKALGIVLQQPDDSVQMVEDSVGKLFLAHFIPNMFLQVQFRCIRWQSQSTRMFSGTTKSLGFCELAPSSTIAMNSIG